MRAHEIAISIGAALFAALIMYSATFISFDGDPPPCIYGSVSSFSAYCRDQQGN